MRILFINGVVDYGSTGRIVRELSNDLIDLGHETLIAYGRMQPLNTENTYSMVSKYETLYHVLMTRLFGRHGLHSNKATKKLIKEIDSFKPDVVHLHNIHGYYLNYEILFNHLKTMENTKVLWTHHDCWSFSGSSSGFEYHGVKTWDEGCVECNSVKDYPQVFLYVNQRKNFNRKRAAFTGLKRLVHVTPSQWLTDLMMKTFHKTSEIITINNGIDTNVFKPIYDNDKLDLYGVDRSKKILLGVASQWELRKGLEIFKELSKNLKDDEQIVLVGVDEATKKSLPENIIAISRTNNVDELAMLYSAAYVFLNPTLEDNFPTTNLEALACGTPVITFKTGGSPEAVDKDTGIVVDDKSWIGIRNALDNLIITEETANLCRNRAVTLFDKTLSTKRYLELITKED